MVRRACRERALVDARLDGFEIGRRENTIQLRDGAAAVEAVAGVDKPVALAEIGEAAAARPPFVSVAHQDPRQIHALGDMVQDRARLLAAAQP